jgi:dTDP-4-dehydrorhamnose reductase
MKFVITGADGQLGLAFGQEFTRKGVPFLGTDLATCDIASREQVERMLDAHRPSVLINCAAYNLVDEAENNRTVAFKVNTDAVKILAHACQARGIKFVHYSTDYVFDGKKGGLYTEEDATGPLNVYGLSKYEGEAALRAIIADHLVLRTSWVYGEGKQNFLYKFSQWAQKSGEIKVSVDEVSVPTYVEDIVWVTLKALEKGMTGLYHLTSSGYASRYEWAKAFVKAAGLSTQVMPVPMSFFSLKALRPSFSAMSNEKISKELGIKIPSWQEGVEKYVRFRKGK